MSRVTVTDNATPLSRHCPAIVPPMSRVTVLRLAAALGMRVIAAGGIWRNVELTSKKRLD